MKCEEAEDLIQNYLDLSLSHEQRISLEKHVELCANCREELRAYKHLVELFELEEPCPDMPEDFTQRVMSSLPEVLFNPSAGNRSGLSNGILKVASLVAVVAISIGLVQFDIFSWTSSPEQKPALVTRFEADRGNLANTSIEIKNFTKTPDNPDDAKVKSQLILKVDGGVVHVRNSEGFHLIQDGQQHALAFFDEIKTGVKASASIIYPEGDIQLRLKPGTRVQIARNSLRLFHGSSWVNIVKKGTNFEVKTPNLIAAVRGTIFAVSEEGVPAGSVLSPSLMTRSTVSVFEGVVEVRSLTKDQTPAIVKASRQISSESRGLGSVSGLQGQVLTRWASEIQSEPALRGIQVPGTNKQENNGEILPGQSFSQELGR